MYRSVKFPIASAGPKLRAGFIEPPVRGPPMRMSIPRTRPMAKGAAFPLRPGAAAGAPPPPPPPPATGGTGDDQRAASGSDEDQGERSDELSQFLTDAH